jgi:hypothetical protein
MGIIKYSGIQIISPKQNNMKSCNSTCLDFQMLFFCAFTHYIDPEITPSLGCAETFASLDIFILPISSY